MSPPTLPTPGGSATRAPLAFFSRALLAFQHSASPFQVICTLNPPPTQTQTRPRTLIILDSSFNPPTLAHLHMATSALRAAACNKTNSPRLLLLLSVQNADKPVKPAGFAQRLAMMHVFAGDVQRNVGDDLVVLVGFDTLVRIFDAKYYGGEEGMRREVGGFLGRARLRVTKLTVDVRMAAWWGTEKFALTH
ncbi:hypothetical protein B0T18DRAFT_388370 [Schizothecium vesticola]|uniref:Nicotinamide-nucleotide adenylyltransferase n=1 Tax=Schizothecium vesticola TaxID=314040 RepID=A0AA40KAV2_9PEZI|nr:hypothetical protein B0T18DRAFT_388370 [Schizothecium vesticola]